MLCIAFLALLVGFLWYDGVLLGFLVTLCGFEGPRAFLGIVLVFVIVSSDVFSRFYGIFGIGLAFGHLGGVFPWLPLLGFSLAFAYVFSMSF